MLATDFVILQVAASKVFTVPIFLVTNVIHRKAAQLHNPKNISSQINKKNVNVLHLRVKYVLYLHHVVLVSISLGVPTCR
jgi:hypothetical protein